jgi:transcriptional regulator with XRE-family HTH domain
MNVIARSAKQLGSTLRRYRRQKGLTQRSLGELMHARQESRVRSLVF